MDRRGFLKGILALGIAPAVVRASSLMPIAVLEEPRIILGASPIPFIGEEMLGEINIIRLLEERLIAVNEQLIKRIEWDLYNDHI